MRIRTIGMAALLGAALALPAAPARAADCENIDAQIAAAKTAADHEAVAACYDALAKASQDKAAEHVKMKAAYKGIGAAQKFQLPQHCDYFTKTYAAEAKAYEQMAAAHRKMAKNAK
jgi:hypothetical protein